MPVVSIPAVFLDRTCSTPTWTEVRIEGRTYQAMVGELLTRFPQLAERYTYADGRPATDWFGLWREEDEYELRYQPEAILGEDDRVQLINMIGC
ncbi:MAG TPA: hypothetical protein VKE74_05825 [Gemmataceae bacterium]|nr:hypothetical protein [Gemmataceae bacterium]